MRLDRVASDTFFCILYDCFENEYSRLIVYSLVIPKRMNDLYRQRTMEHVLCRGKHHRFFIDLRSLFPVSTYLYFEGFTQNVHAIKEVFICSRCACFR